MENPVTDFFEDFAVTRETLDRRYDDLEGGRVKPVPGDEVFASLRARSAARRAEASVDLEAIWEFIGEPAWMLPIGRSTKLRRP